MVTVSEIRGLAERLSKAEALVADGAVLPVAGLEGYSVVRNGDGSQMYLVRHDDTHVNCTCPDFQERQKQAGYPCKHVLAAQLFQQQAETQARKTRKQQPKQSEPATVDPELVDWLTGQDAES